MKNNFLITTTSSVQGLEIKEYYGYISANFVIGANWFNDCLASFTDFVGGVSNGYTKEIDTLKERARFSLQSKAKLLGMNGIIGFNVDLDPIFGSGYSMFMVSVTGTAVLFSNLNTNLEDDLNLDNNEFNNKVAYSLNKFYASYNAANELNSINFITCEHFELEEYLALLKKDSALTVLNKLIKDLSICTNSKYSIDFRKIHIFKEYFCKNSFMEILKELNSNINKEKSYLIRSFGYIHYGYLLNEFKSTSSFENELSLIYTLDSKPDFISKEEFSNLCKLDDFLKVKYDCNVEIKKTKFKKQKVWICKSCKFSVDFDRETCPMCDKSKFGIKLRFTENDNLISLSSRLNFINELRETLSSIYN